MVKGLLEYMEEYASTTKQQYPGYEAIYICFANYLNTQYEGKLDHILQKDLSAIDIVDACVYYVENENSKTSSKTAITRYIRAMTKFHKEKLCLFNNTTIEPLLPFSSLRKQIEMKITKNLDNAQSAPPISYQEYRNILDYFENNTQRRFTQMQTEIIIRLILLYGFKYIKIKNMKKMDFDIENRRIIIERVPNEVIKIPEQLLYKLGAYRRNNKYPSSDLMFCNTKGNQIKAAYLNYSFNKIRDIYDSKSNSYCATGLAKFAIINLIKSNFSISDIRTITGMEDVIISDCAMRFLEMRNDNVTTSDITTVDTYKDWDR